ncbi:MAG: serine/threonine protein kinase [Symploca sp. SIO3E6]|nr:serine/threonine protein kinase [Caldora sp. SIO3E6]
MKLLHGQGEVIAERYQIVTLLGQGGMGSTYAAVDLRTNQRVAIKVVSLQEAGDWKTLELFQREAQILATLNHPFIPNYLDYFQLDVEEGTANSDYRFYLVQELVEGESLAALVKQGWHTTEAEVKDIARQVLEILTYIHQLNPPIIHRDIKPQNIIRRTDGKVYLVDFGAVQTVYNQTIGGSKTLVGTFGYMPVEQFQGKVHCASDLYSLGCTLIFLLTHRSPADLPQKRMKIDFRQGVDISNGFATWLESMSEPMLETRFQSATEALLQLQQPDLAPAIPKPKGTHIQLTKTATKLTIKIPHYHHKKARQAFATGLFTSLLFTGCACLLAIVVLFMFLFLFSFLSSFIFRCTIVLSMILYLIFQFKRLNILLTGSLEISIEPHIFKVHSKNFLNNRYLQGNPKDLRIIVGNITDSINLEKFTAKNENKLTVQELKLLWRYQILILQFVIHSLNVWLEYEEKKLKLDLDPIDRYLTDIEKRWLHQEISNFMKTWNLF